MSPAVSTNELHWLDTARAALDSLAAGDSVKNVAARLGVSVWCIYDLRLERTFKHLGRVAYQPP
jgi:hypothetical protein